MKQRLGFGTWAAAGLLSAMVVGACGGKVVVDHHSSEGGGGAGGDGGGAPGTTTTTPGTTTTTTSTTTTTTTTTTTVTITGGETLVKKPLGTFQPGTSVTFDIPPNALGFTLVAKPTNGSSQSVALEELWAPDGAKIVNDFSLGPQNELFSYVNYGILGAGVPQSDDAQAMPVQPGTWTAEYWYNGPGAASEIEVSLWIRQTVDGQFHGGVLDVNVFLVPGVANPGQILTDLEEAYADWGGIKLGNVAFYDLPNKYDIITEDNFHAALQETKIAQGKPALNVLYIGLLAGQLDGAGGVSSGLPGVAIEHGTRASGVFAMHFNDVFDVIVLKHEAGHFAGLFHTTEVAPGNGDYLADTPQCESVFDLFDACPDYENIMFPSGGTGDVFSPMQARVLQGSDVYRGVFQPGVAPAPPFFLAPPQGKAPWLTYDATARTPSKSARVWTAPPAQPWARGLPFGAADALGGLVCPHGAERLSSAWEGALATLSFVSDETLLSIATEPSSAPQARVRALQALAARGVSGATATAIADVAASEAEPNVVRIAAIHATSRASAAERSALEGRLGGAPDIVKRIGARLLR